VLFLRKWLRMIERSGECTRTAVFFFLGGILLGEFSGSLGGGGGVVVSHMFKGAAFLVLLAGPIRERASPQRASELETAERVGGPEGNLSSARDEGSASL
jgi:hypothetical protein